MKKYRFNRQILVECLTFIAAIIVLLNLILTDGYKRYLTPRSLPFLWIMVVILFAWLCLRSSQIIRTNYRFNWKHCLLLIVPLLLITIPHPAIDYQQLPNAYVSGTSNTVSTTSVSDSPAADSSSPSNPATSTTNSNSDSKAFLTTGLNKGAKLITITDATFYNWIAEIFRNPSLYVGYTVSIRGFIYDDAGFPSGNRSITRLMMSCCVADLTPFGILAQGSMTSSLVANQWYTFNGTIVMGEYNGSIVPKVELINYMQVGKPADDIVYP